MWLQRAVFELLALVWLNARTKLNVGSSLNQAVLKRLLEIFIETAKR